MTTGIKINAAIPWTMVIAACIAAIVMYRDVQDMKANMIKAERIASLEARVASLDDKVKEANETHGNMWRAIGSKQDRP